MLKLDINRRHARLAVTGAAALALIQGCASHPPVAPAATPAAPATPAAAAPAPAAPDPAIEAARAQYANALELMKAQHYQDAVPLLEALAQQQPGLPRLHTNLGIAYLRTQKNEAAEKTLREALNRDRNDAVAFNQLGVLYRETGRFKEAQDAYKKAITANPDYANAHLNLAILLDIYLQQPAKAVEHYQRYQNLTGEKDPVQVWIADAQRRTGSAAKTPADKR